MEEIRRPPAAYFQALGLNQDARGSDVAAAYYQLRVQLKVDGASDAQREQLDHGFLILGSYFRRSKLTSRTSVKRRGTSWRQGISLTLIFLCMGLALVLILPTAPGISILYEPGDVLYWKEDSAKFGVVVGYDPAHSFRVGESVAAYRVHLADSADSIWISRSRVDGGMQ